MAPKNDEKHPFGTTLLARDTPENRKIWGSSIGVIDVAASVCTPQGQCPYYRYIVDATHEKALETPIHILIASFRDRLCPRTLHNAFSKAENPKRIFIRVIEQTLPNSDLIDDAGCFDRYCQDYNPNCDEYRQNVRIVALDARLSKGPTDARSKLSAMIFHDYWYAHDTAKLDFVPVQLHDFCLQLDSHMDFSDRYDTGLIAMHHRTQNDYAVLSTYVADISQNNKNFRDVPNLCMVQFTSTIRNWGTKICHNLVRPKLTNMWGAGLSFHRAHAELAVPIDPYTDDVFDGEEGSRAVRFFTAGYDVYTPDVVLVTHDYHTHQGNPVVHTWGGRLRHNQPTNATSLSFMKWVEEGRVDYNIFGTKRINLLLGIGKDSRKEEYSEEVKHIRESRFGLGNKRTLEQAIDFFGIDFENRKMVANKCGNLIWVPFAESVVDYGVPEILGRLPKHSPTERFLPKETKQSSKAAIRPPVLIPDNARMANQLEATSTYKLYEYAIFVFCLLIVVPGVRRDVLRRRKQARHTN